MSIQSAERLSRSDNLFIRRMRISAVGKMGGFSAALTVSPCARASWVIADSAMISSPIQSDACTFPP